MRGQQQDKSLETLIQYCSPVGNQDKTNSCVGWAIAQAYSFTLARQDHIKNDDLRFREFSAYYLHKIISNNCQDTLSLAIALERLKTSGICTVKDTQDCTAPLKEGAEIEAQFYRIFDDVESISDTTKWDKALSMIDEYLKDNKRAVVVDIYPTIEFSQLDSLKVNVWKPSTGNFERKEKGHAMVVVACYLGIEPTVLLLNSWGSKWGKKGFIKMYWRDLKRYLRGIYTFRLDIKPYKRVKSIETSWLWQLPYNGSTFSNPAFVNSHTADNHIISVDIMSRQQWITLGNVAPKTVLLRGEYLFKNNGKSFRPGVGLEIKQSKISATENCVITGRLVMRQISNEKAGLVAAFSGSYRQQQIKPESLYFRQKDDPLMRQTYNQSNTEFGLGVFGYWTYIQDRHDNSLPNLHHALFGGLSMTELFSNENLRQIPLDALTGYRIQFGTKSSLAASVWWRYVKGLPLYINTRLRFALCKNQLWLDGGYTNTQMARLELGYMLSLSKTLLMRISVAAEQGFRPDLNGIGLSFEEHIGFYRVR